MRYEHSMGQGLPDFIHRIGQAQAAPLEAAAPQQAIAG
jgi:hypothetical protein